MSVTSGPPDHAADPDPADPLFTLHRGGKMQITATVPLRDERDLALAYTPGVARVCTAIADRPALAEEYTWRANLVAVVTDGTAVLGLGDIGPAAALPVMEGKAILFKTFGGVDAVPLALATTDVDEIVETLIRLAPSFGGINLEDISSPRCFEIERRLQDALQIPVFHDDQHGTAVVTLAALRNAARLTGRTLTDLRVVISGAGAAGIAIATILLSAGIGDVLLCDRAGALHPERPGLTDVKREIAERSNPARRTGPLASVMAGAHVFIGVSGGTVPEEAVASMAKDAVIFAMANPDPEIHPDLAHRYAAVVATGRSDHPNQINNVLAFPGIFAGALAVRATHITEGMKTAAALALADLVGDQLSAHYIIPGPFDPRVAPAVAEAVAAAARADGVARRPEGRPRIPRPATSYRGPAHPDPGQSPGAVAPVSGAEHWPGQVVPDAYRTLCAVLVDRFQVDPGLIRPEATLAALGFDFLAVVELLAVLPDGGLSPMTQAAMLPGATVAHLAALLGACQAAIGRPGAS